MMQQIRYSGRMSTEIAAIKEQLLDQWQKIAVDLIKGGVPAEIVFETMLTVGLAGQVEIYGKDPAVAKLTAIAEHLSEQARLEKEALREASSATKN
ncbi:hypothetical protein [Microvirga subterranea]|uniref:Uncharacterized protein n=1 Tax=Microvirga subterranea TaxID=186651 RepID=A0A370H967_9HYPH|nr:hypothetical protein [Microvirga subterranea]RDI52574.1 hypothetical protein DES45_11435 [Microvirga subterranea]